MNFFPVGPLVRRSGVFFIRRSFKDNPVYKFVLQHYIDYLIEKRFSLEWYIEGGRSRSGKLLPPRFGLLAYVVDAYRRGKQPTTSHLIPVSIAYDQITDVGDYAAEQQRAWRQAEGELRLVPRDDPAPGCRRSTGNIHIALRGADLAGLRALGPPDPSAPSPTPTRSDLALQKLAFEVCVRINQRHTDHSRSPSSALALLGQRLSARSHGGRDGRCPGRNLLGYVGRTRKLADRGRPMPLDLSTPRSVSRNDPRRAHWSRTASAAGSLRRGPRGGLP